MTILPLANVSIGGFLFVCPSGHAHQRDGGCAARWGKQPPLCSSARQPLAGAVPAQPGGRPKHQDGGWRAPNGARSRMFRQPLQLPVGHSGGELDVRPGQRTAGCSAQHRQQQVAFTYTLISTNVGPSATD
eukprot:scaffold647830_cov43-Prasinocladus_malaysianus.AAC.1